MYGFISSDVWARRSVYTHMEQSIGEQHRSAIKVMYSLVYYPKSADKSINFSPVKNLSATSYSFICVRFVIVNASAGGVKLWLHVKWNTEIVSKLFQNNYI